MVTQSVWSIKVVLQDVFPTVDTNGTWGNICTLVEKLKLTVRCIAALKHKSQLLDLEWNGAFNMRILTCTSKLTLL